MAAPRLSLLGAIIVLFALTACKDGAPAPVRVYYVSTWSEVQRAVGMRLASGEPFKKRGVSAVVEGVPLFQTPSRSLMDYDLLIGGQGFPVSLIANGYRGKIVATLGSGGELSVLIPPGSAVERASDLKARRVKSLPVSALNLYLESWLRQGGVDPSEVAFVDYDTRSFSFEQLRDDRSAEAYVTWSPLTEKLMNEARWHRLGGARGQYFTTVLMSQRLLDRPHEAQAVLLALLDAVDEHAKQGTRLDLSPDQEPFRTELERTLRLQGAARLSDILDSEPMRQARRRWRAD